MDELDNDGPPAPGAAGGQPHPSTATLVDASEYEAATGEALARTLDIGTWLHGEDLAARSYERIEREIAEAVEQDKRVRKGVRERILPILRTRPGAPPNAGVYQARTQDLERIHRGLLLNGAVEGCDGTIALFDTLPITIAQIGVCLVSYRGDEGCYVHRIYRRDLRVKGLNPVDEALEILERRRQRTGFDGTSGRDGLSSLLRRGVMAYAERAALLFRSKAQWLMGHGNPAPYELLTGSGSRELLESSLVLLRELVLKHRRFVFVPSAPAAHVLLTIGNALDPLQYAIVGTQEEFIRGLVEHGNYRGDWAGLVQGLREFAEEAGPQIVVGSYRVAPLAPAQIFYAHVDYAHEAALIAMADSALQEHRGFPMMIDLAHAICRTTFGADTLMGPAQVAYAKAGVPFCYLNERQTRG